LEILFLVININFVCYSIYLDDITGYLFSFFLLITVGAESAIALALVVKVYKHFGSVDIVDIDYLTMG
jgi:NADH-quinone oxidoreductase subunit K